MLELAGANALFAPMVQHLTLDGSLDTPEVVEDPFLAFPCALSIYIKNGCQGFIKKYPLFYCADELCWQTAATTLRRLATPQLCRRFRASPPLQISQVGFSTTRQSDSKFSPLAPRICPISKISRNNAYRCRQTVHLHTLGARCFAENSFGGSLLGPASDFLLDIGWKRQG